MSLTGTSDPKGSESEYHTLEHRVEGDLPLPDEDVSRSDGSLNIRPILLNLVREIGTRVANID